MKRVVVVIVLAMLAVATPCLADGPLALVTQVPLAGTAKDVVLAGGLAYVATSAGLTVLDVSTPEAPTVRGSVAISNANGVAVRGTHAFVTSSNLGLKVVDVSNPSAPRIVASRAASYAWAVDTKDDAVYVSSIAGKLFVFAAANPVNPQLVKTIGLPAWKSPTLDASRLVSLNAGVTTGGAKATDVTVVGNHLFTVDWGYGRLYYYDVTTATAPVFAGTHYVPYVLKVDADPTRDVVYMLSAYGLPSGIYTVPLSLLAPNVATHAADCTQCAYLKSTKNMDQGGLHVVPAEPYFVYGGGRYAGEFHVVRASDAVPPALSYAASMPLGTTRVATAHSIGMKISGDHVYVAAGVLGLQVYRFAGLTSP